MEHKLLSNLNSIDKSVVILKLQIPFSFIEVCTNWNFIVKSRLCIIKKCADEEWINCLAFSFGKFNFLYIFYIFQWYLNTYQLQKLYKALKKIPVQYNFILHIWVSKLRIIICKPINLVFTPFFKDRIGDEAIINNLNQKSPADNSCKSASNNP